MDVLFTIGAVLFGLLMLFLVAWLSDLERRVRRLEAPRAPVDTDFAGLPARRRSSGAE